jgi:hypothetical protein
MPSIMPEGVAVRKAIQWISQMRQEEGKTPLALLIEKASVRFNLPPKDCEFLNRFFSDQSTFVQEKE